MRDTRQYIKIMKLAIGSTVTVVFSMLLCGQLSPSPHVRISPELDSQYDVSRLKIEDRLTRKQALFALHDDGKDAIPVLIEFLDDTAPFTPIEFKDPYSSYIVPESLKPSYRGILYAYAIELILGKQTLRGNKADGTFLIDHGDCVYPIGILRKNGQPLTKKDMDELKAVYRAWWDANKHLSLVELRQRWIENKRPLTGSNFRWT